MLLKKKTHWNLEPLHLKTQLTVLPELSAQLARHLPDRLTQLKVVLATEKWGEFAINTSKHVGFLKGLYM